MAVNPCADRRCGYTTCPYPGAKFIDCPIWLEWSRTICQEEESEDDDE